MHQKDDKNISDSALEYFDLDTKEILNKLTEFSEVEIDCEHQGEALRKIMSVDGFGLPPWAEYLLLKGLIQTRRELLDTYRQLSTEVKSTVQEGATWQ